MELTSATWFQRFGLRFDPYEHFESSSDPHLIEYIIHLDIFRAAWDIVPTAIFAPSGGGKTATRIAVSRACWFDMGGVYPFPLPYNAGLMPLTGTAPTYDQHLRSLLEVGTAALLTGLAFRPERLLRTTPSNIRAIGKILRVGLPGELDYYLDVLRETGNPIGLTSLLERTYALTTPPPITTLNQFCAALAATDNDISDTDPERLFNIFVDLVINALGFNYVLILIDGIDSISEHLSDPALGLRWIAPLIDQAIQWSSRNIIVKFFLPDTMTDLISNYSVNLDDPTLRQIHIYWTSELLVKLLKKRILVASDGKIGSLDAISSPELFDVEQQIVNAIPPLPRAALQVTRHALQQVEVQLNADHVRRAISWYQNNMTICAY